MGGLGVWFDLIWFEMGIEDEYSFFFFFLFFPFFSLFFPSFFPFFFFLLFFSFSPYLIFHNFHFCSPFPLPPLFYSFPFPFLSSHFLLSPPFF